MPENIKSKSSLSGGCHCGNIHFELQTDKSETEFIPRTCQCSLCEKHDASWISDPEGTAVLSFEDKAQVSFYRFGHFTSDFIICKKCGVLTMGLCELDNRTKAVLNIKAMSDHDFATAPILTNFDDETVENRLIRRAQNWTAHVTIKEKTPNLINAPQKT